MDNKKNGIPKLRFPGFTGAWEQRKLSSMTQYKNGKGHEDKQTDSGDFELVNLNSISIDGGFKHSGKFINESDDGILYKNDLVMILSDVGHGDLLGRVALIPDDNKFILNQRVALLRPNKTVNPEFLFFYINSHQKYFKSQGAGMSQLNISKKSVETFSSLVPNIDEQKKISLFLMKLDSLIALHQRKLEHLQEQKKGLLQKMFPKNGETVPEVRFPGFTDAWEQRKLGDLAEIVRGASPRPISDPKWFDDNSDIGWLRISDVTNQNGRIYYLEQHISKLGQEKTRVITEPHLLLSIAATVGKPLINYIKTGVHDGFLIFLNPKFDLEYMYQWLEMFRPKWNKYGQPGSQVNLNSNLVRKQKIALPSREEQQRISSFLKQLDSLIALHQRKLDHLELMKKGLLQQMFV
ncbi:restriction endonuclease subunit S [Ligilactobacillus salivarius]|uniref:restriction endonuclease subunit S n=1 Tax=Ligilactobacillus salivarius TaxID=1624 RepID=UPI000B366874|nr:restriction endonuclease subunit S [Ligilactobacillus salivarius]OUQ31696.1 restriction endonuclease subunit S [Ligilactobacillus salivarius]